MHRLEQTPNTGIVTVHKVVEGTVKVYRASSTSAHWLTRPLVHQSLVWICIFTRLDWQTEELPSGATQTDHDASPT